MRPYRSDSAKLPDLTGIIFSLFTMIHTHWLSLWSQDMPNSFPLICTSPSTWHMSASKSSNCQIFFIQVLVQISPHRLFITSPSCLYHIALHSSEHLSSLGVILFATLCYLHAHHYKVHFTRARILVVLFIAELLGPRKMCDISKA